MYQNTPKLFGAYISGLKAQVIQLMIKQKKIVCRTNNYVEDVPDSKSVALWTLGHAKKQNFFQFSYTLSL